MHNFPFFDFISSWPGWMLIGWMCTHKEWRRNEEEKRTMSLNIFLRLLLLYSFSFFFLLCSLFHSNTTYLVSQPVSLKDSKQNYYLLLFVPYHRAPKKKKLFSYFLLTGLSLWILLSFSCLPSWALKQSLDTTQRLVLKWHQKNSRVSHDLNI